MEDCKIIKRSYDWLTLDKVVEKYKHDWLGFDAKALVEDDRNILVEDDRNNFGLFEYEDEGIYFGHYLFKTRGPENTYKVAKELLTFFFEEYPCQLILGLTPTEHTGAINLNKKLGLTFHRIVETEAGPHYEVSITKRKFINE